MNKYNDIINRFTQLIFYSPNRLFVVVLLIFTSSCELDEDVYSFRDSESVFASGGSTDALLGSLTTAGYTNYWYYQSVFPATTAHHSLFYTRRNNYSLNKMTITPSESRVQNAWREMYTGIATANIIISTTPENPETENEKNARGLALFTRAGHYFMLARLWGGVPLVLNPEDKNMPRSTRDETFEQIVEDLEFAFDYLAPLQNSPTKPKKMAAAAYLAAVYHHWASLTNDISRWEKARDWAKIVIDAEGSGEGYRLLDDFAHLWDLNHEFSDESIMEIGFTRAAGGASFPIWWSIFGDGQAAKSQNGGTIINYHLADSLISIYNGEIDYRMKTQTSINQIYYWPMIGGDNTAAKMSYPLNKADLRQAKLDNPLGLPDATNYTGNTHILVTKYRDPAPLGNNGHENNAILMRYSEVLLIAAEAECELNGGPNTIAIDYLNRVLTRARKNESFTEPANVSLGSFNGLLDFRARLLMERANEFIGEHHAWMDERRFGIEHFRNRVEWHNTQFQRESLSSWTSGSSGNFGRRIRNQEFPTDDSFLTKNLLWPIPENEINNNTSLTFSDQNPEY